MLVGLVVVGVLGIVVGAALMLYLIWSEFTGWGRDQFGW